MTTKKLHIRQFIKAGIALLCGFIGMLFILFAWRLPPFSNSVETTDNAYIRGQMTIISPQISGAIIKVNVSDYQHVKEGDILFEIDDRIYQQKYHQAEANLVIKETALENINLNQEIAEAKVRSQKALLESAKANLETARLTSKRIETLLPHGAVTQSTADHTRSDLTQAETNVKQAESALDISRQELRAISVKRTSLEAEIETAKADIELARINLQYTKIKAPIDGRLGEVGAHLGQFVSVGTQLVYLVPEKRWVIANFKEKQIYKMKLNQPVSFTVDALNNMKFKGYIEAFSPATGSEFTVLKPDNATGNFTKVAQRVPVKIAIDSNNPLISKLNPGMSVVVSINVSTISKKTKQNKSP